MKFFSKLLTKLNRTRKGLLTLLLTANLVLATGAAELASPSPSPSPTPEPNNFAQPMKIDPTGSFVEDELVVKFKDGTSDADKAKVLSENKAKLDKENDVLGAKLLKVDSKDRDKILETLKKDKKVEYAEINHINKITAGGGGGGGSTSIPNDPYYSRQWHLSRINAPSLWITRKGSSSVMVAVLDTGINGGLPEFYGRLISGRDFVNNDNNSTDDNGHGTSVASVLGAVTNNGIDLAGVDWYSQIVAVKTNAANGTGTNFNLASGITWATNYSTRVKVINASVFSQFNDQVLKDSVNYAHSRGVTIVAATTNSSAGTYNCFIGFPAGYSGVIAAVGTTSSDTHGTGCTKIGTGTGSFNLLSAPGINILTEYGTGGVISQSGTSFATPQIAGAASIFYSCNTSRGQIIAGLDVGAKDLGGVGYDSVYGYGRLDMYNSKSKIPGC